MLKNYATILLVLHLMASTPLGEIIRLPFLIHHCYIHFQKDGDMDYVDFLKMHYASGHLVDEDFHQDMQLPFKAFQVTVYTVVGNLHELEVLKPLMIKAISRQSKTSPLDDFLPSSFHALIWQPPRLV